MLIKKWLLWILTVCVLCGTFSSCGKTSEKYSSHSFDYFDTVTTVTGYAPSREAFDLVCADIFAVLSEYHKLFTIYERYEGMENLCTVNELHGGAHRTVTVDEKIIRMLTYAKAAYTKTNGQLNVAMGSVLSIWHEYRENGIDDPQNASAPPMQMLLDAAGHTDISALVIDEANNTVTLTDPMMRLDVGAIAKGYAVEMAAQMLEAKGVTGYVLNVGGNVRTVGVKNDGTAWLVGIENPEEDAEEPYIEYLRLSGESVVTSGSYQRYYVADGVSYHHIIDPDTWMPAEGFRSVSVVCKSSADGDMISTALFCMPYEEGAALVASMVGVEAMWVLPNGEKRYSEGFSAYLAN